MNIVIISSGKRPELLEQTINSMRDNAVSHDHHITVVFDGWDEDLYEYDTKITNFKPAGASASRNIGASSIPTYRRQKYVMFSDDDCYYVKGWDEQLERALDAFEGLVISGHAHPFNHPIGKYSAKSNVVVEATQVISTVNIAMDWYVWDKVGYWVEPGGPGGSEDVHWCKRLMEEDNLGLAITVPQVVIHTGLTSSRDEPIVGADMVMERNRELEVTHGIVGKVRYE